MTDNEIVELFFNRSEQAIAELASKHGAAVGKVAAARQTDEVYFVSADGIKTPHQSRIRSTASPQGEAYPPRRA